MRSVPARLVSLLVLALAAGCGSESGSGDAGSSGAEPASTGRYAVVARHLDWTAVADPVEQPLSVRWDLDEPGDDWRAVGGTGEPGDDGLRLRGIGSVALEGPGATPVDVEVHHWLAFRVETQGVERIHLQWRTPGLEFNDDQKFTFDHDSQSGPRDVSLRLGSLRGRRRTPSATEGVDLFRLTFEGEDGAAVAARVEDIALLSDFESPDGAPLRVTRLDRGAVIGRGAALRLPGRVETTLDVEDGDRLRVLAAVAGRSTRATLTVDDASGRLPVVRHELTSGAPWTEVELDLSPLAGDRATLRFAGDGDGRVLMLASAVQLRRTDESRPNVLVYLEDTLRADRLGAYGYEHPTDPVIARVAEQGVVIARTFASANWTRPSISSLMTSLDPADHGNINQNLRIADDAVTLAEALADAGYLTVSMVTNHHAGTGSGLDRGFDVLFEPNSFGLLEDTSTLTSSQLRDPVDAFLREHADERLFLYVHSLDPHAPYVPEPQDLAHIEASEHPRATLEGRPPNVQSKHDRISLDYDAEIYHNDVELGRLDETLTELGLRDDTLFVFVSDHGEAIGERRRWEHRQTLFQEEVHVPWVMRLPGRLPAGEVVTAPASHVDVAPTILGLLGEPVPPSWRGTDLSAACLAPGEVRPPARTIYVDCLDDAGARHVGVVRYPFKLMTVRRDGQPLRPVALFNLDDDADELHDLKGDPRAREHVETLLEDARAFLDRDAGRVSAEGNATELDPEAIEWMRMMGYLK